MSLLVRGLRLGLQTGGTSVRARLLNRPGVGSMYKVLVTQRLPRVTLFCCGAVGAAFRAARCQEAALPVPLRRSVARVQVHKLVFLLRISIRALVLLLKFGPLLLLSPLALVSTRWASWWLDALLWVTESSGPTFIKLGQWASTRRDIFSSEFCDRMSRLHVRVRPHPWAHTKQCLSRAFGPVWTSILVFDSKEPVGSGCVAQVYRGWARVDQGQEPALQAVLEEMEREDLLEAWEVPGLGGLRRTLQQLCGRGPVEEVSEDHHHQDKEHMIPVAIKVVHPGMRRQVEMDLLLMKITGQLLQYLPGLKWLSLFEVVEEFEKLMTKQIDLRFEASNMERFRKNFSDIEYVKFPTPLRPYVSRNVLVETFEESEPISKYLSSEVSMEVKKKIARMGVDTLLKMVFVDNFVHGDLHPGNILVQCQAPPTASHHGKTTLTDLWDTVVVSVRPEPCPFQLVLLDAGLVAQLSDGDLANFKAVFTAVVLKQGERVAELILHHARKNECQDVGKFKKEMGELVDHALSSSLSLGKIQVADLLSRVFGLLIKHKVKLESNFASIVFAIMVLEGLGRSLDPNLDVLELAKPLLLKNCATLL